MHGGKEFRLQKIKYARRNAITTPEYKICAEGRDYDSEQQNMRRGMRLWLENPENKICVEGRINTPENKIRTEERDYDSRR